MFVVTRSGRPRGWQIHDKLYHLLAKAYGSWNDPWIGLTRVCAAADVRATDIPGMRAASRNPYSAVTTSLPALSQADAHRLMAVLEAQVGNGRRRRAAHVHVGDARRHARDGFTIGSHTENARVAARRRPPRRRFDELAGSKHEHRSAASASRCGISPIRADSSPRTSSTSWRGRISTSRTRPATTRTRTIRELTIQRLLLWEGSSIDADGQFSSAILNCQTHRLWPPARRCERIHAA